MNEQLVPTVPHLGDSAPIPSDTFTRILASIQDEQLRVNLQSPRGGAFARAVANEIDQLRQAVSHIAGPGSIPGLQTTLMTDGEAAALDQFLKDHFPMVGNVGPQRLLGRTMMILQSLAQKIQALEIQVGNRGGNPTG